MACTHPRLMAVADLSKKEVDGDGVVKKKLDFQLLELFRRKGWKANLETMRAYRMLAKDSREFELESIPSYSLLQDMEIPCGNCIQCRLDYSKTWAIRCYLESLQFQHNYFVTLTYDDAHIRLGLTENPTVLFTDFQKFIKKLRRYFKYHYNFEGIRYFGCTEYGDQSFRPHGHIILFNCPIPDLTYDFVDDDGQITHRRSSCGPMMFSKIISDLWENGFVTIEDANYNTEAYVSRYIMKKQKGIAGEEVYDKALNIEPPRLFMSLKPAIGGQYFMDNEDYLLIGELKLLCRLGYGIEANERPGSYRKGSKNTARNARIGYRLACFIAACRLQGFLIKAPDG